MVLYNTITSINYFLYKGNYMLKIFKDITQYCNSTIVSSQYADIDINIANTYPKITSEKYIRYRVDYLFYKDSFSNFLIKKFPYTISRNKNVLYYFFSTWVNYQIGENTKPEYNKDTEFINDETFYKLPDLKYSTLVYSRSLRYKG